MITGLQNELDAKQPLLTAGAGITLNNNIISSSGGGSSYTAGTGININSSNVISSNLSQINVVAPLTASTSGSSVTIESFFKPTSVVAGTGIHVSGNDGTGLLNISTLGVPFSEQDIRDRIISNISTLGTTAQSKLNILSTPAAGVFISVDPTEWATKQDLLTIYSEQTTTPTYLVTTDEANSVYFPFLGGTYTNTNTHTQVTLSGSNAGLYNKFLNPLTTGIWNVEVELQAGTTNEMVLTAFHGGWTNVQYIEFTGLTTSWQTFTWTFNALSGGDLYVNFGFDSFVSVTQTAGTVLWKNWRIYQSASTCDISAPLTTDNITSSGAIQCVSLVQTSDEMIKENIENCDLDVIQKVFDNIDVKQYQRTDHPGNRIGFIAQDWVANSPEEYANIVHMTYGTGNMLYGLDYARINCILWGVCKNQQKLINSLDERLKILEQSKT